MLPGQERLWRRAGRERCGNWRGLSARTSTNSATAPLMYSAFRGAAALPSTSRWSGSREFRRLILVCTAFGLGSIPANPRVALELLRPARYFSPSHLARVGPALFGGETRRHPELLRHQAELRSRHRPSTRGYLYQLVAASTWVSLPLLPLIQAKTLVLLGAEDPIVHVVNGRILRRLLPRANLEVVPGAGHLFLLDQPKEAAAIVRDFLSTDDAPRSAPTRVSRRGRSSQAPRRAR